MTDTHAQDTQIQTAQAQGTQVQDAQIASFPETGLLKRLAFEKRQRLMTNGAVTGWTAQGFIAPDIQILNP